jgi:hypothetical protein
MTTSSIKKQIHKAVDIVDSASILKAIQIILNAELKHKKDIIRPFTMEEFYDRNNQSQKEIKQGKLTEHKHIKLKYAR